MKGKYISFICILVTLCILFAVWLTGCGSKDKSAESNHITIDQNSSESIVISQIDSGNVGGSISINPPTMN